MSELIPTIGVNDLDREFALHIRLFDPFHSEKILSTSKSLKVRSSLKPAEVWSVLSLKVLTQTLCTCLLCHRLGPTLSSFSSGKPIFAG